MANVTATPSATPTNTPTATATASPTPPPTNEVTKIQRTYYSIAGQAVGVRVKKILTNGDTESDKLYYMYTDHLGNVGALSDENGNYISGSLTLFRPFGEYRRTPSTNPDITDRAFTGHRHNDDIGLIYMRARFYLPEAGRFLSADTLVPDPMNPQQLNRYTYSLNSPLNYSDPTGHFVACGFSSSSCENNHQAPWLTAMENYKEGKDLSFGPLGSSPAYTFSEVALGPIHFAFEDSNLAYGDVFLELDASAYLISIGGGFSKEFSFSDPKFEGPFGAEIGEGLGLEALGIGLAARKSISINSENTISMQYMFTAVALSIGDGLQFDQNSVIIRPSDKLAGELSIGNEAAWQALWQYIYERIPADYEYLGSAARHDSFDYEDFVPIYTPGSGILR